MRTQKRPTKSGYLWDSRTLLSICFCWCSLQSKITSRELLVYLSLAGAIWMFNHYLISSGVFRRIMGYFEDPSNPNGYSLQSMDNMQQLNLLYETIYAPVTVIESSLARAVLWLTLTLLANVVCITIELKLFQDQF